MLTGEDFTQTFSELLGPDGHIQQKFLSRLRDGFMNNRPLSFMTLDKVRRIYSDAEDLIMPLGELPKHLNSMTRKFSKIDLCHHHGQPQNLMVARIIFESRIRFVYWIFIFRRIY